MQLRTANIGTARGILPDGIAQTLELPLANVLELDAIRACGRGSVEINRDSVAAPDLEARLAREKRAIGERRSADGDERDDVRGADARMHAVLLREVDELCGLACAPNRGFDDRF